jgi:hypothetical protein
MNLTEWLTLETEDGDIEFKVIEVTRNGEPYDETKDEHGEMVLIAEEWARDAEQDYYSDMREMFNDD